MNHLNELYSVLSLRWKPFNHINRLREDPTLCELFGLKKIIGDDALRRLFRQIGTGSDWIASTSRLLWQAAPERFILDWDSTVQTRHGHQEGACVDYNPQKPGRKSHHPLLAVIADSDCVLITGGAPVIRDPQHSRLKQWKNPYVGSVGYHG